MTQVKERPILFSGPMVRAILEGRKTVTRRTVKQDWIQSDRTPLETCKGVFHFWCSGEHSCPYGCPGDRLWVREAWVADAQVNAVAPRDLSQGEPIRYPADGGARQTGCAMITPGKSRPSIHMPRWASRILLEITTVRVERLQDITPDQAIAEGVRPADDGFFEVDKNVHLGADPRESFEMLWRSTGGDWNANPWVWVVEFRRVQP
ncbi:hypothetical protein H7A76_24490 [Pseudomonas sp. MSSRFD41]|uniref:hypothetical protein n=1 Tax=Pseudomonas sp. MSSRFD41 TaxID=1310370 RepID=UPI00163A6812|nr:hypothetical protein [Pseudomonas sp. MSSRFD41]MBC2658609.1 hypothetical protein [Pseudomonas sp. MSSRFD41]